MNATYKCYLLEIQRVRQYKQLASAVHLTTGVEGTGKCEFSYPSPAALIPGTPCYCDAKRRKNRYLASARRHDKRAASLAAQLGIAHPPVFWQPRPTTTADRRIAKQYDPNNHGWGPSKRDEHGVHCVPPALAATELAEVA
jgi:hypothetical protein